MKHQVTVTKVLDILPHQVVVTHDMSCWDEDVFAALERAVTVERLSRRRRERRHNRGENIL